MSSFVLGGHEKAIVRRSYMAANGSAMELSVKLVVEFESVHHEYHTDEITNDLGRWVLVFAFVWCFSLHACMPLE